MDCTVRTVHRDLAVLAYAGVPWYFDRDADGYRVRDGVTFPTLPLTDAEAFSQALAEEVAANVAGFGDRLSPKLTKDRDAAEKLEDARSVVSVSGLKFGTAEGIGPKAEAVRFAVLSGLRVRGTYSAEGGIKTLDLHPYQLCLLGRAWYVVGRNEGEETSIPSPKGLRCRGAVCNSRRRDRQNSDPRCFYRAAQTLYRSRGGGISAFPCRGEST